MRETRVPLRSEALQEAIQERIKQHILEHQLTPGAALPTEGDLARDLGVSRTAVREAIKVLQTLGIVETRHGHGSFVGDFSLTALVDGLSFRLLVDVGQDVTGQDLRAVRELLEVRQALECALVPRLPALITPATLADLRVLVARMEARAARGELFPEEDRAFHEALYRPLNNRLVVQLLQAFWDVFHEVREALPGSPPHPMSVAATHKRILEALERGDGVAASDAMAAHFDGIQLWAAQPFTPPS